MAAKETGMSGDPQKDSIKSAKCITSVKCIISDTRVDPGPVQPRSLPMAAKAVGRSGDPQMDSVKSVKSSQQQQVSGAMTSTGTRPDILSSQANSRETEQTTLAALPERRSIPQFPEGDISQQEGEAYCKLICETYPKVFNGEKGCFRGAEATMLIKEGHMDLLK